MERQVHLGGFFAPGPGNQIVGLELANDFRGFASEQGETLFQDGFESGDISAWSSVSP